jgi:hypothetical protein
MHGANISRGIEMSKHKSPKVRDDDKQRSHKIFLLKFPNHFNIKEAAQFFHSELLNKCSTFVHRALYEYTA